VSSDPATTRSVTRRRVITLGGLGLVAIAAGAAACPGPGGPVGTQFTVGESGAELTQPPVLAASGGRLSVALTAARGVRLAGRDTGALGFNGSSPGPTLRVLPGDELAVRLTSRLDQPTNLHTHGLRVSPEGNGDNPFLRIDPDGSFDYLHRIPADHPAGTFWYHPHHHGTDADQVFGGLVGALIVDGDPGVAVDRDLVLLVTDISLTADGEVVPTTVMDRMVGREGALVLVNGQHRPVIPATTGELQRWRIINGCTSRVLPLRLADHRPAQIAVDGVYLTAPDPATPVLLAPGNRADLLVSPERPGRFELAADGYDRGGPGMGGMGGGRSGRQGPVALAVLDVSGPPRPARTQPSELPATAPDSRPAARRRVITLNMAMGMGFTIDGRSFDPRRDDQIVALGAVEEWTLVNESPMTHPFHLHVWPFTVTATSSGQPVRGTAQDVVLVPARGWVRIRIPFTEPAGRTVFHCHVLDHEDLGMMATITVRAG
jgi:FtsP/CotA-like multicopper oxidase with cupredoxin domain